MQTGEEPKEYPTVHKHAATDRFLLTLPAQIDAIRKKLIAKLRAEYHEKRLFDKAAERKRNE